jgi:hypothetical protein
LRALDTINILSTDIHSVTEQEVVDLVEQAISDNEAIRIGVVNAAKLVNMQTDPLLADDVKSSDLVLADGMSTVWASRILGEGLPERVAGCDLMYRFFELANKRQWRVYCLGATEEISALVEKNLSQQYPHLKLAVRDSPSNCCFKTPLSLGCDDQSKEREFYGNLGQQNECTHRPRRGGQLRCLLGLGRTCTNVMAEPWSRMALSGQAGTEAPLETLPRHQHKVYLVYPEGRNSKDIRQRVNRHPSKNVNTNRRAFLHSEYHSWRRF